MSSRAAYDVLTLPIRSPRPLGSSTPLHALPLSIRSAHFGSACLCMLTAHLRFRRRLLTSCAFGNIAFFRLGDGLLILINAN